MGYLGKVDEREAAQLAHSEFLCLAILTLGEIRLAIILFDGVCNLCNAFIRWIILRDQQAYFKFAPLQSDTGQRVLSSQTSRGINTVLLVEDGRIYTKSEAALRILRQLGGIGRLSPALRLIPRGVRDGIYDFVARNRYGWFGRRDQCMVPTDDVRSRFLD